ncbi:MAG TPA: biotin transporter BioY [Bacillota bacterium]|nr:biotin transporter BioY [Bacillota bacterium]
MKHRTFTPRNMVLGGLFVALTAIGANITSILPFMVIGGVPITLQTFFAILSGLILGSRLGAFTMFVYMMLGLAGVPVFAQFKGGISMLLSPTFGFIVSFILIAYVAGKLVERKQSFSMYIVAALVAMALNYIIGTHWMYAAYIFWFNAPEGFSYKLAWMWMMVPLPKDIVITVLAGMFAFRLKRIIPLPSKTSQQQVA